MSQARKPQAQYDKTQEIKPRRSKQRIQTIQLEPYDDVVSIRDRLQFVKVRRVLLIFPKHGEVLRRKLDLVLIQREAARRNIQIALLCKNPDVAEHAASINIDRKSVV